jgi:NTP pyrophosphatase (non-canonical NTP hydrolase)
MKFEHYKDFVNAGVNLLRPDTRRERLMLAGMGLAGEAGEVCDEAKKVAFHGKKMDNETLIEELGDVLWYYTLMLDLHGLTVEDIMHANVYKLCERYPDRHGDPDDIIAGRAV